MTPCAKRCMGSVDSRVNIGACCNWNKTDDLFIGWINYFSCLASGGTAPLTVDEKAIAAVLSRFIVMPFNLMCYTREDR